MSLEGTKMEAWNGLKMKKTDDPPLWLPPHLLARSGRVRWRLAVKFSRQGLLVVALLPGWRVHQGGGRKRLPRPIPVWSENGSKRPSSESSGFGGVFPRVLELKMGVLGLGFYLA